jgi:hypothetical protein
MRKRDEMTNPAACMTRARDDEMTFVLLGRDVAAPATIRLWVQLRITLGKNKPTDPQIVEALECARVMEEERAAPVRQPTVDLTDDDDWRLDEALQGRR